jgi:hypothetical protein
MFNKCLRQYNSISLDCRLAATVRHVAVGSASMTEWVAKLHE